MDRIDFDAQRIGHELADPNPAVFQRGAAEFQNEANALRNQGAIGAENRFANEAAANACGHLTLVNERNAYGQPDGLRDAIATGPQTMAVDQYGHPIVNQFGQPMMNRPVTENLAQIPCEIRRPALGGIAVPGLPININISTNPFNWRHR